MACWFVRGRKRSIMIAVIELKGKQYRVASGMVIRSLQVEGEPGSTLDGGRVLATIDGDSVKIGQPVVSGAKVTLEIVRHAKSPKITVYRYNRQKRTTRKLGYRDRISYLRVKNIEV
jgi:large subunit ribosomal protein L21